MQVIEVDGVDPEALERPVQGALDARGPAVATVVVRPSNAKPNCASFVTRTVGFTESGSAGYCCSTDGSFGRLYALSAPTWVKMPLISGMPSPVCR